MVVKEKLSYPRIALIFICLPITGYFNNNLTHYHHSTTTINDAYRIASNIQSHLTLGYDNSLSVLRWIQLIGKFNSADKSQADYHALAKDLDIITRLNPQAEHAYYMAATILPWGTKSTTLSRPLLKRAHKSMPTEWQWPYYEGFNAYWFDHDLKHAAELMSEASFLPYAPPLIARLAARMQAQNSNLDAALFFLQALLKQKQAISLKITLQKQIKLILTEKILLQVDNMLIGIPTTQRNSNTLQRVLKNMPSILPDGGSIILNKNGIPVSSQSKKRFKIFTPPKRQGVIQHESAH